MKILCATEFYPPSTGGMQISNYLIIEELRSIGYEVKLLVFSVNKKIPKNGIGTFYYHFNMRSIIDNYRVGKLIKSFIKEFNPSFTLLMDNSMDRSIGMVPFFKQDNNKIVSINSGSFLSRNNISIRNYVASYFTKKAYKIIDHIFLSDSTFDFVKDKMPLLENKMSRLGRPVPDYFFNKLENKSSKNKYEEFYKNKPYFFSCSRAIEDKGIKNIIFALNLLKKKHSDEQINFIYCGDGPELENWRVLVKKLNLRKIFLIGNIPHQKLKVFYDNCFMTIFPSFYEGETFGRTWVESFACGKPVISTLVQNLKYLVRDNFNAITIDGTPESIANAIEHALSLDHKEYTKLVENSKITADPFRQSLLVKNMIDILKLRNII